jgi:hypothetical protein
MRPDLPAVDFDWDPETWEKAAQRAVELAVDVSTGWEKRRPGPEETPDQTLKRFREPLPRSPVPFDAIADRLEELASLSTFIGHPRWCGRARRSAGSSPAGSPGAMDSPVAFMGRSNVVGRPVIAAGGPRTD